MAGEPRLIAWNGVSFSAPAGFEPVRIDRSGLGLADMSGSVREGDQGPGRQGRLEVFWGRDGAGFRPEARLGKLGRTLGRSGKSQGFRTMDLPEAWRPALRDFQARAFSWSGGEEVGALLFCPGCGTVSVIRFLGRTASDEATQAHVLGTFADHPGGDQRRFAVFDLDLRLPEEFHLDGQSFATGHFRLSFYVPARGFGRGKALLLDVHRFGPADALLTGRSLADCAGRLAAGYGVNRAGDRNGHAGRAEWTRRDLGNLGTGQGIELLRRPRAWPGWLPRLFTDRTGHAVVRLWRVEEKNRLLAVVARSGAVINAGLFESLCAGVCLV